MPVPVAVALSGRLDKDFTPPEAAEAQSDARAKVARTEPAAAAAVFAGCALVRISILADTPT